MAQSYYGRILDLVRNGHSIGAIALVRDSSGIGLVEAKRWVEEFTKRHAIPIMRGERPADQPFVLSIPGLMGGEPCIAGTRVPASMLRKYMLAGKREDEVRRDYPSLPEGCFGAVERWIAEKTAESAAKRLHVVK